MSSETRNLVHINGYCAKGFQPLKELFVDNFYSGKENNAQLCIYVNDECVVDLYGTAIGDTTYTQDTIQVSHYNFRRHNKVSSFKYPTLHNL